MGMTGRSLTDQSLATGAVDEATAQIAAEVGAILTMQATGGTLTTDGTEQTLYVADEPLGVFAPVCLFLDLDAMLAGDTMAARVYHRLSDAGTIKLLQYLAWTGADGGLADGRKIAVAELYPNRHGFQVTLQRTAGSDRAIPWELFLGV